MKHYDKLFLTTTDTVVGIGCFDPKYVDLIYQLKKRPVHKKIIILVSSIKQAKKFQQWNLEAEQLAKRFWPGAVTLIVNDQGFRMPNCPKLLEFLEKNGPAYVTSANISGQATLNFEQTKQAFPMIKNRYYFCEGSNIPSKIIDVSTKKELR